MIAKTDFSTLSDTKRFEEATLMQPGIKATNTVSTIEVQRNSGRESEQYQTASVTMDSKQANQLVDDVNRGIAHIKEASNYIQFQLDESSGQMVFYMKDSKTNEVLRQIPSEVMLRISTDIKNYLTSLNPASSAGDPPKGLITNTKA